MKPNMGELERILRATLGVYGMLLGFLFVQGTVGTLIGVVGAIAFLTGAVGWCGVYALLGRGTVELATVEVPVDEESVQS